MSATLEIVKPFAQPGDDIHLARETIRRLGTTLVSELGDEDAGNDISLVPLERCLRVLVRASRSVISHFRHIQSQQGRARETHLYVYAILLALFLFPAMFLGLS